MWSTVPKTEFRARRTGGHQIVTSWTAHGRRQALDADDRKQITGPLLEGSTDDPWIPARRLEAMRRPPDAESATRSQLDTEPARAFTQVSLMPGPGSAARCCQPVTLSMNAVRFAIIRPACSSTVSCSAGRPPSPRTGFFPRRYKEQARSVHR